MFFFTAVSFLKKNSTLYTYFITLRAGDGSVGLSGVKKTNIPISTYLDALIPNILLPRHISLSISRCGAYFYEASPRRIDVTKT